VGSGVVWDTTGGKRLGESVLRERIDAYRHDDLGEAVLHLQRYSWAALRVPEKNVADAACGFGYGRVSLENHGCSVTGFDRSRDAIQYAQMNYPGEYEIGDIQNMTFSGFDALVCLETLEHLEDPWNFVERLDVPKAVFSAPIIPTVGINPYHLHDFTTQSLRSLVEQRGRFSIQREKRQRDYLVVAGARD
jgi:SAM-dependent methyltransferase